MTLMCSFLTWILSIIIRPYASVASTYPHSHLLSSKIFLGRRQQAGLKTTQVEETQTSNVVLASFLFISNQISSEYSLPLKTLILAHFGQGIGF